MQQSCWKVRFSENNIKPLYGPPYKSSLFLGTLRISILAEAVEKELFYVLGEWEGVLLLERK